MPGVPRRENRLANLQCNDCGQRFVRPLPHVAIETSDIPHPIGWVPESTSGARCPWCGSELIGFQED